MTRCSTNVRKQARPLKRTHEAMAQERAVLTGMNDTLLSEQHISWYKEYTPGWFSGALPNTARSPPHSSLRLARQWRAGLPCFSRAARPWSPGVFDEPQS